MERDCPHRGTVGACGVWIEVECCRGRQRHPGHLLNKTGDAGRVQFRAPAFPARPSLLSSLPEGRSPYCIAIETVSTAGEPEAVVICSHSQ